MLHLYTFWNVCEFSEIFKNTFLQGTSGRQFMKQKKSASLYCSKYTLVFL